MFVWWSFIPVCLWRSSQEASITTACDGNIQRTVQGGRLQGQLAVMIGCHGANRRKYLFAAAPKSLEVTEMIHWSTLWWDTRFINTSTFSV